MKIKKSKETGIGYRDIFRQKEYCKVIAASLINRFGDSIDAVAYTWVIYEITGNAAWSAIIFGLNNLPSVLVAAFAGAWVEGRKKKNVMIATDLLRAICVAFVASAYLMGFLEVWMLVITTLTISTAEAFRGPANTALTPLVLDREYYEYGMSLQSTLSSAVQLIGIAAAGGIVALIGTAGAIYIDVATFILSAGIILTVGVKEEHIAKERFDVKEYAGTLKEGIRYVAHNKVILYITGIGLFLNMALVPFNSLQAPLADEILGGGAEVLSLFGIVVTLGMMLGSFTFPMLQKRIAERIILFLTGLGIGIFYIGLIVFEPVYGNRWLMCISVVVFGGILGYTVALGSALVSVEFVKQTEKAYLARAGSIFSAVSAAAMPVTSFLVSGVVVYTGIAPLFIGGGVLGLIAGIGTLMNRILDEGQAKGSVSREENENNRKR